MPGKSWARLLCILPAVATLHAATWDPVTVLPPTDNGQQRTLTDTAATGAGKFYHIEITKP